MKIKKISIALVAGLAMGLGPWILLKNPSVSWYPVSLAGGVLVAIAGYGAQMAQLGQGDTGEELLDEVVTVFKAQCARLRRMLQRR